MPRERLITEKEIEDINNQRVKLAEEMAPFFGKRKNANKEIGFDKIEFEDYSYTEIGKILDLSTSTISRLLAPPTPYDERQPKVNYYKITGAKVRILNQYKEKITKKHQIEISTLRKEIAERDKKIEEIKLQQLNRTLLSKINLGKVILTFLIIIVLVFFTIYYREEITAQIDLIREFMEYLKEFSSETN